MSSYNIVCTVLLFFCIIIFEPISAKSIKSNATTTAAAATNTTKPETRDVCTINLKNDMHKERPPMIVSMSSNVSYFYPSSSDPMHLSIGENATVGVFCPRKSNRDSSAVTGAAVIFKEDSVLTEVHGVAPIVCKSGKKFNVAGEEVDLAKINCKEQSHASYNAILREHSKNPKCSNGRRYEIGFDVGHDNFLQTIELCHDKSQAKTLWAHAVLVPANQNSNRHSGDRQSFKTGILYGDMHMGSSDPFNLKSAYETVNSILGAKGAVDKYMSTKISDRKFLAKGHLIASADKIYKSEQDSTMFFANVVPMWQQVNANPGNWFLIEEYVRHLAFHKKRELDVWAGGIGVLKLEGKEMHLYKQGSGQNLKLRIPVPKVIYKCVVDKSAQEALCFLVVNNPYAKKAEVEKAKSEYRVCKKLETCDKISLNYNDPAKGYMYCCELGSFYRKNHKELGLDGLKAYVGYKKLKLLTKDKLHEPIAWAKRDEKKSSRGEQKKNAGRNKENAFRAVRV